MLKVTTLGKFTVSDSVSKATLTDEILRSDMLKKLFVYLISHREHPLSVQELFDALWQGDETDNPAGALKNLMYRLRTALNKQFGDQGFILTSHGSYSWNTKIEIDADFESFEEFINRAKDAKTPDEMADFYEAAITVYEGDFLENAGDMHWMVTQSAYFHSQFLSACKQLISFYMKEKEYEDVERVCNYAIRFDTVDEGLYCDLIRSLIKQKKNDLAVKNYEAAKKTLHDSLGVSNSKRLVEVQNELLKMDKGAVVEKMQAIREDMSEEDDPDGVYLVGYPVFKEVYRMETRRIGRLGEAEYVLLLTAQINPEFQDSNEQMNRFLIKQAMGQLESALKKTLRIGDVAARFSDSQFVILLPTCTYETTKTVANRILGIFKEKARSRKVIIQTEMEQVTDAKSSLIR